MGNPRERKELESADKSLKKPEKIHVVQKLVRCCGDCGGEGCCDKRSR